MSFDKNYPNRKDKRQPFRKAKAKKDIKEYKLCEK